MADQWKSFFGPIQTWVDCWFAQNATFEVRDDSLYVRIEGSKIQLDQNGLGILCILSFHQDGVEDFPNNHIEIKFFEEIEGYWDGDVYPLTLDQ